MEFILILQQCFNLFLLILMTTSIDGQVTTIYSDTSWIQATSSISTDVTIETSFIGEPMTSQLIYPTSHLDDDVTNSVSTLDLVTRSQNIESSLLIFNPTKSVDNVQSESSQHLSQSNSSQTTGLLLVPSDMTSIDMIQTSSLFVIDLFSLSTTSLPEDVILSSLINQELPALTSLINEETTLLMSDIAFDLDLTPSVSMATYHMPRDSVTSISTYDTNDLMTNMTSLAYITISSMSESPNISDQLQSDFTSVSGTELTDASDMSTRSIFESQSVSSFDLQSTADVHSVSSLDVQSVFSDNLQTSSIVNFETDSTIDEPSSTVHVQSANSVDEQSVSSVELQSFSSLEVLNSLEYSTSVISEYESDFTSSQTIFLSQESPVYASTSSMQLEDSSTTMTEVPFSSSDIFTNELSPTSVPQESGMITSTPSLDLMTSFTMSVTDMTSSTVSVSSSLIQPSSTYELFDSSSVGVVLPPSGQTGGLSQGGKVALGICIPILIVVIMAGVIYILYRRKYRAGSWKLTDVVSYRPWSYRNASYYDDESTLIVPSLIDR